MTLLPSYNHIKKTVDEAQVVNNSVPVGQSVSQCVRKFKCVINVMRHVAAQQKHWKKQCYYLRHFKHYYLKHHFPYCCDKVVKGYGVNDYLMQI